MAKKANNMFENLLQTLSNTNVLPKYDKITTVSYACGNHFVPGYHIAGVQLKTVITDYKNNQQETSIYNICV